ncbi:hypothetical protein PVAND_011012 [Polypedilum vanderplanki]|uniref:Uncharacterized protein n=1 Tax=Polypedilum vanderplanki TaxID=319348 RepID=A0A9J6CHU4_POLVA|nr:hypothetical protein PVAND_011012 [Polypedilum vanderplanki]
MSINNFSFESNLITKNLLQSKIRINVYESKHDLRNPMVRRKYASSRIERLAKPNVRRIKSIFDKQKKKSNFDMKKAETFIKLLQKESNSSCEVENLPRVRYTKMSKKCNRCLCNCYEKSKRSKIVLRNGIEFLDTSKILYLTKTFSEFMKNKNAKENSSNKEEKTIESQHLLEEEKIKKIVDFSLPVDIKNSMPSQRNKKLRIRRQTGFVNQNNSDEEMISIPRGRRPTGFIHELNNPNENLNNQETPYLFEQQEEAEEHDPILMQARNFLNDSDPQILTSTQNEEKLSQNYANVFIVNGIDRIMSKTEDKIYSKLNESITTNSKIFNNSKIVKSNQIEEKSNKSFMTDDGLSSHLLNAIMSSPSEWRITSINTENLEFTIKTPKLKAIENSTDQQNQKATSKPISTVFATREYDDYEKIDANEEKLIHVTNDNIDKVFIVRELENEDAVKRFCKCSRARKSRLFQAIAKNPIEIRRLPLKHLKKYCGKDHVTDLKDVEKFYLADVRKENFKIQRLSEINNAKAQSTFKKIDIEVKESFTNDSKFTVSKKDT